MTPSKPRSALSHKGHEHDKRLLPIGQDKVGNQTGDKDGRGNTKTQDVNQLNQVVQTTSEAPFLYRVQIFYDSNNNVVQRRIENKDGDNVLGTPPFFIHPY